jgi:hypothetical protein
MNASLDAALGRAGDYRRIELARLVQVLRRVDAVATIAGARCNEKGLHGTDYCRRPAGAAAGSDCRWFPPQGKPEPAHYAPFHHRYIALMALNQLESAK